MNDTTPQPGSETPESISFRDFQNAAEERGGFETDDVLSALLPLMEQVLETHDRGLTAPLCGLDDLKVTHGQVWYHASAETKPSTSTQKTHFIEDGDRGKIFDVVDRRTLDTDLDQGTLEDQNIRVWNDDSAPKQPCYVTRYRTWEHLCGHHDALTDIYSLGILLAALATGLDLNTEDNLDTFADGRNSIHTLCPRLHPVVASAILRMTELRRSDRVQDLRILINYLKNYRDQKETDDLNLTNEPGFVSAPLDDRRQMIHAKLRDRLFEINKRNRLIYFRPTMQTVNLTVSSVPTMLDYRNIRPEQLFTWQPWLSESLAQEKEIPLNRYLRFEDAAYLPHSLDTIRRDANRDRKEYGFAQLRLVTAFFRWHNLKEDKTTRIHSPLLLHPVELTKKKGVRDSWHLQATGSIAEVNPVLRNHLKQLYDLDLPEAIDLAETSIESLYEALKKQINASEPAVEVKKIDRPQIDLIYETARKRLDKFLHRRRASGRAVRNYDSLSYSYRRDNFQPLGLQLFLHRVQHSELPLEHLVKDRPSPRLPQVAPTMEKKRESYSLREGSENNPYIWDFDLCSITLGNFNYRKMSLVRDYNTLLQKERPNSAFDEVFSLNEDEHDPPPADPLPMDEQHLIVAADPTQISAIAAARSGRNLIIQGPPGTGKSQTITNLITNYVAQGKRVLFVCEKRAALDVVYHRLASQGLDQITCLIHDSQADKKSFIHDLRETYEKFTAPSTEGNPLEKQAAEACLTAQRELEVIERFAEAMRRRHKDGRYSVEEILDRLLTLGGNLANAGDDETLPGYEEWVNHGSTVRRLGQALEDIDLGNIYANTAFQPLRRECYEWENPVTNLKGKIANSITDVATAQEATSGLSFSTATCSLDELLYLSFIAESARYLARHQLLSLLDPTSAESQDFNQFLKTRDQQFKKLEQARQQTTNWAIKIPASEVETALSQATLLENSGLRFLKPAFWKLRKIMRSHYNFSAHTIAPSWSDVLAKLHTEYQESAKLQELEEEKSNQLGVTNLQDVRDKIDEFSARRLSLSTSIDHEDDQAFIDALLKQDENTLSTVEALASMQDSLRALSQLLEQFLIQPGTSTLPELTSLLTHLESHVSLLPEILPELLDLSKASPTFYQTLRERSFTPDDFEQHCAAKSLELAYRDDRSLKRFEGWILRRHSKRIRNARDQWMSLNGERTVARVRSNFLSQYNTANKPAAQLTTKEKEFKKTFNRGRRELEHEFSKTMRYRSIRDLSSGESGQVLSELKPIWLMSPLSISDTIALDEVDFDVVIFDEASQIRLEEAVPAIYRAEQVIVVGDEMQLPPTNFFSSKSDTDDTIVFEEDDQEEEYDLGADSFLSHAGRNLSSTMLGWHYRSHFESLISFSNTKFYHGNLLTIPDLLGQSGPRSPIVTETGQDPPDHSTEILDRSISFHFQESAIYEHRKNKQEAYYIAHQVRSILTRQTGLSIGIVAFSEAQQNEIDSALTRLSEQDPEFRTLLADEFEREEDDQFCGLFVKNLENVQGDERDIMILSICYGPDANNKMRMNFGPINRTGGEKRLNVIFSRAKRHMVIVSSIRANTITNDYNDGARCLKQFLEYAEAVCTGNDAAARRVLGIANSHTGNNTPDLTQTSALSETLYQALTHRGYQVDRQVGQSNFRCDLALRQPGENNYQLGILLVDNHQTSNIPALEQYVLRPALLEAFGWKILEVLAKDWLESPAEVIEKIDRLMSGQDLDIEEATQDEPDTGITHETPAEDKVITTDASIPAIKTETEIDQKSFIFENSEEGGSQKFWNIERQGTLITVHFGKSGTKGQRRQRSHDSEKKALTDFNRAIRQKLRKGYTEISG